MGQSRIRLGFVEHENIYYSNIHHSIQERIQPQAWSILPWPWLRRITRAPSLLPSPTVALVVVTSTSLIVTLPLALVIAVAERATTILICVLALSSSTRIRVIVLASSPTLAIVIAP